MDKEYWFARWQSNEIGFNQKQPNLFLLQYLSQLSLGQGSKIFAPLCGKSIDMLWLAEQGYQVVGVELSLQACKEFFKENNLSYQENKNEQYIVLSSENITLLCGDFFALNKTILGQFDAIYDRAALVALPLESRQQYAQMVNKLTDIHTQILLITASYNQKEMQGPPFSVDENEVKLLYGNDFIIHKLLDEPTPEIPEHLRAKGLTKARQLVFHLSR